MKFTGQLQWTDYLNAQLLHLKPNKFVKSIYYVSFFIMALLVIQGLYFMYLFIIGEYYASLGSILMIFIFPVALLIILPLYRYVFLPNQIKKIFNQQKELNAPFEMEITDDNLVVSNKFGNAIRPWNHFTKWKENEDLFLLYHSDVMFTMIPKRMFADAQQIKTIESYLEKNKVSVAKSYSIKSYIFYTVLFVIVAAIAFIYFRSSL